MVATADTIVKTKTVAGNKVSKPLMEKKRRARINQCLDQLKSLLENYYSNNIRKRKLEKADILELTVKHLRNLQKIQSCNATTTASEFSEYQAGFRSCLTSVNQYLLMADNHNGNDRWMLTHLANNLRCAQRPGDTSSTTDSGSHNRDAQEPVMQRLLPSLTEPIANKAPTDTPLTRCSRAPKPHFSAAAASSQSLLIDIKGKEMSSGPESVLATAPKQHVTRPNTAQEKICSNVCYNDIKSHAVNQLKKDDVITQQNVWRPW